MSALTASDIAAQEAVIIVGPDLMAMSALPLQVLWGEAHGSISIEEGQPSFADHTGAMRGAVGRALMLQLETQFCADTIITARNLWAEAPAGQPDRAVACKAAPRRYRC